MKDKSFRMGSGSTAVVLVHGLTGTPAEMRWLGKQLAAAGYSVYGVHLAGHCGTERELAETTWMDWQASDLNSAWRHVFMARVRRHPDYPDDARAEASLAQWNHLMGVLDTQLAGGHCHVTGNAFTLADIAVYPHVAQFGTLGLPVPRAVEEWLARVAERPSVRSIAGDLFPLAVMGPEPGRWG